MPQGPLFHCIFSVSLLGFNISGVGSFLPYHCSCVSDHRSLLCFSLCSCRTEWALKPELVNYGNLLLSIFHWGSTMDIQHWDPCLTSILLHHPGKQLSCSCWVIVGIYMKNEKVKWWHIHSRCSWDYLQPFAYNLQYVYKAVISLHAWSHILRIGFPAASV